MSVLVLDDENLNAKKGHSFDEIFAGNAHIGYSLFSDELPLHDLSKYCLWKSFYYKAHKSLYRERK